ncbi:MAG TPA: hypothetical protein VGY77_05440, partial [Gemmataceae bacterium]|nr:hypothetical protein [Gemmataceae bacterium]
MPRELLWGLGLALVILVGYLDWAVGNELYLSFLYLLPIGLVTWFGERSYGLWLSIAAAITKIVADLNGAAYYTNPLVVYWNATVALGAFGIAVYFLSGLRGMREQLEQRVKQQTVASWEEIEVRRQAETAIRRLAAQLSAAEEAERGRLA